MGENKNDLSVFIKLLRPAFVTVGGISLFINVLMLTMPLYMIQVFDRVITSNSITTLFYLTLVAGFALLISAVLDMLRGSIMVEIGRTLDKCVGEATFTKVFDVQQSTGSLTRFLRDLANLRQFISSPVVFSILDMPWVPIYLGAIFLLHPMLGIVALIGSLMLITIGIVNHAWTRRISEQGNRSWLNELRFTEMTERKADVVNAMGFLPDIMKRWEVKSHEVLNSYRLVGLRSSKLAAASKFTRMFLQILILGEGAYLVINYQLTPGHMIAASILLSRGLQPIEQCIGSLKSILTAQETYQRLFNFLSSIHSRDTEIRLPMPNGQLNIENVSFGTADSEKLFLKNVSFILKSGELLILSGSSGSGKSTLARLLVGVMKPNHGIVRLDSADVYTWNRAHFGQNVGYLPQEIGLFEGTVAENIARMVSIEKKEDSFLSPADPVSSAIIAAAELSGTHEMILGLSHGYKTQIGEDGCYLSGGQRQRIGLARAVYGKPKVLVLDEPDSNLDAEGQKSLWFALKAIKKIGTTIVLISHQQRYMEVADKILLLNNGVIDKFAPPDQFLPRRIKPKSINVNGQLSNPIAYNMKRTHS